MLCVFSVFVYIIILVMMFSSSVSVRRRHNLECFLSPLCNIRAGHVNFPLLCLTLGQSGYQLKHWEAWSSNLQPSSGIRTSPRNVFLFRVPECHTVACSLFPNSRSRSTWYCQTPNKQLHLITTQISKNWDCFQLSILKKGFTNGCTLFYGFTNCLSWLTLITVQLTIFHLPLKLHYKPDRSCFSSLPSSFCSFLAARTVWRICTEE